MLIFSFGDILGIGLAHNGQAPIYPLLLAIYGMTFLVAVYVMWLFFESFDHETILTKGNVIFGVIVIVIVCLRVSSGYSQLLINDGRIFDNSSPLVSINDNLYLISFLFSYLFALKIIWSIRKKLRNSSNSQIKPTIKRMRNASILYFIALSRPNYANFFIIISLSILVYLYLSKGSSTFQLEYLRRLIIVKVSGVPVYSHTFRSFDNISFQDTLFSGAITAIGLMMREFVGKAEDIKEVQLTNMRLIIYRINESTSALLLVERSTKTTRELLGHFGNKLLLLFDRSIPDMSFNEDQIKICNTLVEDIFGSADPQLVSD